MISPPTLKYDTLAEFAFFSLCPFERKKIDCSIVSRKEWVLEYMIRLSKSDTSKRVEMLSDHGIKRFRQIYYYQTIFEGLFLAMPRKELCVQ